MQAGTLVVPKVHMSSNESYVVSGDLEQSKNNEYCTIPNGNQCYVNNIHC